MALNYLKQDCLRTGNKKINSKIGYLLGKINGKVEEILDSTGVISCRKIDYMIAKNTLNLEYPVLAEIERNLIAVRNFISDNLLFNSKLRQFSNIDEIKNLLENRRLSFELDIINMNIILNNCENFQDIQEIISEYGEGLEFNTVTITTIFNKCKNYEEVKKAKEMYGENIKLNLLTLSIVINKCDNIIQAEEFIKIYDTENQNNNGVYNLNVIGSILNKCINLEDCEYIIDKYAKSMRLNEIAFGIILNKCKNISQLEKVITNYGGGIEFGFDVLNVILKVLLKDEESSQGKIKEYINIVLDGLNNLELNIGNKMGILGIIRPYKKYHNEIENYIKTHNLSNLNFIIETRFNFGKFGPIKEPILN